MSNATRLTNQQKARVLAKLQSLAVAKRLRRADTNTEGENNDYVIGSRDDLSQTGIKRPCSHCREPVYMSRPYPEDIDLLCEVCAAYVLLKEDAA